MKIIGIDLGGTWIKIGALTENGTLLSKKIIRTNLQDGIETVLKRIIKTILEIIENNNDPWIIGLGSPGTIDRKEGKIIFSPNFKNWINIPICSILEKSLHVPVFIENDAKASAYGEKWFGGGINTDNFFLLTLGTGVGGGAIINGEILLGGNGYGGELGHICVFPDGLPCGCGSKGCLEAYASKSGIINLAESFRINNPKSPVFNTESNHVISIKKIFSLYEENEKLSIVIINKIVEALGIAIGSLVNVLNPSKIILSGGISKSIKKFIPSIIEIANNHTMRSMRNSFSIIISPIQENAGILGAGSMAMEQYRKQSV